MLPRTSPLRSAPSSAFHRAFGSPLGEDSQRFPMNAAWRSWQPMAVPGKESGYRSFFRAPAIRSRSQAGVRFLSTSDRRSGFLPSSPLGRHFDTFSPRLGKADAR